MSPVSHSISTCAIKLSSEIPGKHTVDGELSGRDTSNHDETSTNTSVAAADTELPADLDQTAHGAFSGKTLGLVDFAKHGVGGLGDDGSGEPSDKTSSQVGGGLLTSRHLGLVKGVENNFSNLFVNDELGHCVWHSAAH